MASEKTTDAILVGGGLAGLSCALHLERAGRSCVLLEASDAVGGRVRTDVTPDGFRLDRGFQVYLTAYPEGRRVLDYDSLDLRPFTPGALIRRGGKFVRISDPLRRPQHAIRTALNPLVSVADIGRVLSFRADVGRGAPESLYDRPQMTAVDDLKRRGFSARLINSFFRPFFGGVFCDDSLQTSSRFFEFTFRMFAEGSAAVPNEGIGRIPQQIAGKLRRTEVRLNAVVESVDPGRVTLASGEVLTADAVVVATEEPAARRLLGDRLTHGRPGSPNASTTLYYAADRSPVGEPTLVLDADRSGPANGIAVMSDAAPAYAPPGAALISVSVIGLPADSDAALDAKVRDQLGRWFGRDVVNGWRHLRTYRIAYALPNGGVEALTEPRRPAKLDDGLYVCGDHRAVGSQNGALITGRLAAEAVVADRSYKARNGQATHQSARSGGRSIAACSTRRITTVDPSKS